MVLMHLSDEVCCVVGARHEGDIYIEVVGYCWSAYKMAMRVTGGAIARYVLAVIRHIPRDEVVEMIIGAHR